MSFITELWADLAPARDKIAGARTEHRLVGMIPPERVTDDPDPDPVSGAKFVPGSSYFGLCLAGLHVVYARRLAAELLPLFVCLAEFGRPGAEASVPFSIGPDSIRKRLFDAGVKEVGGAKKAWIELRDLPVLAPQPVRNGNLSLFTGLYTVPGDDLVKTLLNVMGDLGGAVGATTVAPVVKTAQAIYGGFGALLKLDSVHPLAEALNGRALPGTGSGYLLVGNAPSDAISTRKLAVRGGLLVDAEGKRVEDFDYCLLRIEHRASLAEPGSGLAPDLFEEDWQAVLDALAGDNPGAADGKFKKLVGRIQATPSLIEADRDLLIPAYIALFAKRAGQLLPVQRAGTRGAGDGLGLAVSTASVETRDRDAALSKALSSLYKRLPPPTKKTTGEVETGREGILQEAAAIAGQSKAYPEPGRLADALTKAVLLSN